MKINYYNPGHSPTPFMTCPFSHLLPYPTHPCCIPTTLAARYSHHSCCTPTPFCTPVHLCTPIQQAYACTHCSWHLLTLYYLPTPVLPALPIQTNCTCLSHSISCMQNSIIQYNCTLLLPPAASPAIRSTRALSQLTPSSQPGPYSLSNQPPPTLIAHS